MTTTLKLPQGLRIYSWFHANKFTYMYIDCLKENISDVCFLCVFWEDVFSVCGCHGDFFQNEIFICLFKKDDV